MMTARDLSLIVSAYDDGSSSAFDYILFRGHPDSEYLTVSYDDTDVCECTRVGEDFYAVCQQSGGYVSVFRNHELANNETGVEFRTMAEARAYIKGLSSK